MTDTVVSLRMTCFSRPSPATRSFTASEANIFLSAACKSRQDHQRLRYPERDRAYYHMDQLAKILATVAATATDSPSAFLLEALCLRLYKFCHFVLKVPECKQQHVNMPCPVKCIDKIGNDPTLLTWWCRPTECNIATSLSLPMMTFTLTHLHTLSTEIRSIMYHMVSAFDRWKNVACPHDNQHTWSPTLAELLIFMQAVPFLAALTPADHQAQ